MTTNANTNNNNNNNNNATTIERAVKTFTATLHRQVRGIYDIRFALRSSPYAAYYGADLSAFHIYDINGDLFKIIPVNRGELARNPVATAVDAALRAVDNW